ncbi:BON domain-containing protein [Leptolyngbya sp. FACHB-36]|uniref:BON domain-containing protein n=1 Tax=Leptolyngbya sp. FACHB-36 TaxID=2692808 RepID=UPI0016810F70|nr:BON domain-containing protein [Leptolyngbya sp. FACHB-36]MBD2018864.1 BON domain-containing protein [Leptolyngbya sp. FACHB-36]
MRSLRRLAQRLSIGAIVPLALATYSQLEQPGIAQAADSGERAEEAAKRVDDALDSSLTLQSFDLDADGEGTSILLTGRVQTVLQKALAETIAKQTAPDFAIVNRLTIQ